MSLPVPRTEKEFNSISTKIAPPPPRTLQRLIHATSRHNWPSLSSSQPSMKRPKLPIHNDSNSSNTLKRSRRITFGSSTTKSVVATIPANSNDLWTIRHVPLVSTELVVATKKVQEIRDWMTTHTAKRIASQEKKFDQIQSPPILILVGSPGIGKSATVRCLSMEFELDVSEWTESFFSNNVGNGTGSNSLHNNNPIDSFEQFLLQCGSNILPLTVAPLDLSYSQLPARKKIIVIDELPYTHGTHAQSRLQQIITTHIRRPNTVPTIFIYSDTAEGKVRHDDLERFIHPHTLYTQSMCHIVAINPPTTAKFRKVIHAIIESERAAAWRRQTSIPPLNNAYIDELYERCNGDLRFAIVNLQFEMIGDGVVSSNDNGSTNHTVSKLTNSRINHSRQHQHFRDSKLSPFHALGKLLYAKRQVQPPNNTKSDIVTRSQPPLDFDPDVVIRQSDMELGNILHFLSYHSVDFFTDVDELSTAMTLFSDTSILCDHLHASTSLTDIAMSIAGRVVAHSNKHPAPFTFRSLSSPKVYEMVRKRRDNQERIQKYSQFMWHQGSMNSTIFAMDLLPYIRAILPSHQISTSYLDSMFSTKLMTAKSAQDTVYSVGDENQDAEDLKLWVQQEEILKADDIVEDNEDDEY